MCSSEEQQGRPGWKGWRGGKHGPVEKARALDAKAADAMLKAAGRAGKLLMVAHGLPFFPEFAFAAAAVRDGRYGRLLGGHFKPVIAKPHWPSEIADPPQPRAPAGALHLHADHSIGVAA